MSKLFFIPVIVLQSIVCTAQDIQLHYDFGKQEDGTKRDYFVSTYELFKSDTLGYTFLFTDFEFNSPDNPRGVSLGYFEISREFNFPWFRNKRIMRNVGVHVEYNDGSVIYSSDDSVITGENLRNSWLAGLEFSQVVGKFSLNAMFLYKYIRGSEAPDFQWTVVWFYPLFNYKMTLTGYADVWIQQDFNNRSDDKILVLYSEPQVWFNFNSHFSMGSEFKISKNFIPGSKRVEVFPTLGVKWEF
jgi:hypothetical protein